MSIEGRIEGTEFGFIQFAITILVYFVEVFEQMSINPRLLLANGSVCILVNFVNAVVIATRPFFLVLWFIGIRMGTLSLRLPDLILLLTFLILMAALPASR